MCLPCTMWCLDTHMYCEMIATRQLFNLSIVSHHHPFYNNAFKEIYYVYLSGCASLPLSALPQRGADDVFSGCFMRHVCSECQAQRESVRGVSGVSRYEFIQHFTSTGSLGAADACSSWQSLNEAGPSQPQFICSAHMAGTGTLH